MSLNFNNSARHHSYRYYSDSSNTTSGRNSYTDSANNTTETRSCNNKNKKLETSDHISSFDNNRYSDVSWDTQFSSDSTTTTTLLNHANCFTPNDAAYLSRLVECDQRAGSAAASYGENTFAILLNHFLFKLRPAYRSSYLTFNSNINKISNDAGETSSGHLDSMVISNKTTMILSSEPTTSEISKDTATKMSQNDHLPLVPFSASSKTANVRT